ncbi:MAG: hypothetical protein ACC662_05120 [Planctomycetota bacterium]
MTLLLAFTLEFLLLFIVWAALLVFNLWMWQKTKGNGNLLMLVGAGAMALPALLFAFGTAPTEFLWFWLPFIGAILLTVGFYLTAKPIVDAEMKALKAKIQEKTAEMKHHEDTAAEEKKPDAGGAADAK